MKPSERYRRDAEVMLTFRNAFVDLLNHSRPVEASYLRTSMGPQAGMAESRWLEMRSAVASASGPAAVAYRRYGGALTLRNAAFMMNNVDPVMNWELSFKDPEQMPPHEVASIMDAVIATAKEHAEDARQRERGLTGLIAAFLRWPENLREAVGPGRTQRTAAGAIGVVGQIIVGLIVTGIAALLAAAFKAGWAAVN